MKLLARAWWLALLLAVCATSVGAQELVPLPTLARVVDQTNTLTDTQKRALEEKLAAFESAHGSQIAIVIVPTTKPEPIEVYGNRLGEAWKIGRRGVGDGLLLIVAKNDKRVRIEVARTLEGAIPDARAKQIIRETIGPAFERGDFYGGLNAALDRVIALIEGEALPAPSAQPNTHGDANGMDGFAPLFLIALFVGALLRGLFGRFGAMLAGLGATGAGWLFLGLPIVFALGVGLFVALIVLAMGGGRGRGLGGLPIVLGGGGDFGSRGGGGWSSGGGGDFSGGGASGSWN
ncbi:MAG TPA: TPM domain-containing protein [Burkholderiaceae bacterium]|nr:TPM domain-containing protein [Burkholderiaceae bacterium]